MKHSTALHLYYGMVIITILLAGYKIVTNYYVKETCSNKLTSCIYSENVNNCIDVALLTPVCKSL